LKMDKHHLTILSIIGLVAIVGIIGIILVFSGSNTGRAISPATKELQTIQPVQEVQELEPAKQTVFDNELLTVYEDGTSSINSPLTTDSDDVYYWCADVNMDGIVNVLDAIYYVQYKFNNGPALLGGSGDLNNDGNKDILDILYLLDFKFKEGPAPVCGEQPTPFFDLQVIDIVFPTTIYNGQKVDRKILIKNNGNIGGFIIEGSESYCPNDPDISCGGGGFWTSFPENPSTDNPDYIGPGETKSVTSFISNGRFTPAGEWIAEASRSGKGYHEGVIYEESNPDNNEFTKYFSVSDARVYGYAYIGEQLANTEHGFSQIIDSDDLLQLSKWMVSFGGDYLLTEDYIDVSSGSLRPVSSLSSMDYDYGTDVPLEIAKKSLEYCYSFRNGVDLSQASSNNPLEITFMGENIKIVSVNTDDQITLELGTEIYLNAGESTIYETTNGTNYTVTLDRCGNDAVVVIVNGITRVIGLGQTENFFGFKVKVLSIFNDDGIDMDSAMLLIGTEIIKTYNNGDAYIGEDVEDPDWVWSLADLTTQNPRICVVNDFYKISSAQDPAMPGESYNFPNDFLVLDYESVSPANVDYFSTDIEFDQYADLSSATPGLSSVPVFKISTDKEDGLIISDKYNNITNFTSTIYTDTVYLYKQPQMLSYYYENSEGYVEFAVSTSNIDNIIRSPGQKLHVWALSNQTNLSKIYIIADSIAQDDDITIELGVNSATGMFKGLGEVPNYAEHGELWWHTTSISTQESLRTKYGTIILDPNSNANQDKVKLSVPFERFESEFSIHTFQPGSSSSSSSSSGGPSSSSSSSSSSGSSSSGGG